MPQITHMPLDAAIQTRRINGSLPSVSPQILIFGFHCVTLLDEREYEQKEQMWINEERF